MNGNKFVAGCRLIYLEDGGKRADWEWNNEWFDFMCGQTSTIT